MELVAVIIASIGTVIAALALLTSVRSFKKQLQLNFFADYTKRYQEIIINFPESVNRQDFDINSLDSSIRDQTMRYMRAYFDLCSEEYFLWRKGNINTETWREWESGIKYALSKPAFKNAWESLQLDTVYYGDFTSFIDGIVNDHNDCRS